MFSQTEYILNFKVKNLKCSRLSNLLLATLIAKLPSKVIFEKQKYCIVLLEVR